MRKLFAIDLKRLLQSKASIIFTIVAPLVFVILISLVLAPFIFSDTRVKKYFVTVLNEDNHPLTQALLETIIENQQFNKLIDARFVSSEREGIDSLEAGAAAFIRLPKNMQQSISKDEPVVISYYGNKDMALEDEMITQALIAGGDLVNFTQNAAIALYFNIAEIDEQAAAQTYHDASVLYYYSVMARNDVYASEQDVSPFGNLLPVQYYAASLLLLFVALGGIPISRLICRDAGTGLIHRQLLSGNAPFTCFLSKWIAGSFFLLIQFIVLAAAMLVLTGQLSYFSGNLGLLLLCGVLLSLLASLAMMLTGLSSKSSELPSFIVVIALALVGGLIISGAYMPAFLRTASNYTPFSPIQKLAISGMFKVDASGLLQTIAIPVAYIAVLVPICYKQYTRRML